jgi:hypothetical protein
MTALQREAPTERATPRSMSPIDQLLERIEEAARVIDPALRGEFHIKP